MGTDCSACIDKLVELFGLAPEEAEEEEEAQPAAQVEPEPEPELDLAAMRAAAKENAAKFAASLTPEEAAIYGAKVQVAASGVRDDSDEDDDGGADFCMGGDADGVMLGDY